jgi:3-hydroxybutyryl-CoA dehydratase
MLKIGDEFRHKFSYTQEDVDVYAKISGDNNPLHIDPQAGKESIFGRNVIHGFLGVSVFTKIFGSLWYAEGSVYLSQNTKWLRPMFTDQEYEAVVKVKEIFPEKNRVTYECQVFDTISGEQTIAGEAIIMNKKQYVW